MDGVLSRIFSMLALVLAAALAGRALDAALGLGHWLLPSGMVVGAAAGVLMGVALDALRGGRLMKWLRGAQSGSAPRDAGHWGELGYRVERALHQRDRQIRAEQDRLQQFLSAIEASPNGVLLLDAQEQIEWCNSVAADHFGLDPMRDRLQRLTNLVRSPLFTAYLQSGQFEDGVQFNGPSGHTLLAVLVRPFGDGMKLVLSQDITERERAEGMRRNFVANVSHEIRTPLTVLAGFVETLAELPLTPAERSKVLGLMQQQTDRMQSLVADLLTLAQLEGSPRPDTERWQALAGVLQKAQQQAQALAGKLHEVRLAPIAAAFDVAVNEAELFSAVSNLLSNAVRYTPAGGRIELSAQLREDGCLVVAVKDSGIGIAREHLPRLTERFYRVDGSRSRCRRWSPRGAGRPSSWPRMTTAHARPSRGCWAAWGTT